MTSVSQAVSQSIRQLGLTVWKEVTDYGKNERTNERAASFAAVTAIASETSQPNSYLSAIRGQGAKIRTIISDCIKQSYTIYGLIYSVPWGPRIILLFLLSPAYPSLAHLCPAETHSFKLAAAREIYT